MFFISASRILDSSSLFFLSSSAFFLAALSLAFSSLSTFLPCCLTPLSQSSLNFCFPISANASFAILCSITLDSVFSPTSPFAFGQELGGVTSAFLITSTSLAFLGLQLSLPLPFARLGWVSLQFSSILPPCLTSPLSSPLSSWRRKGS